MRVQLGRKGDYAIRAAVDLARHDGAGRRKTRHIAEAMGVPESYLPSILGQLVAAGLVSSLAGRDGGYALVHPAAETTLLQVVEAVEGEVELVRCVLTGGPCGWETECAVHRFWAAAQDAFRDQLAAASLADVVDVDRGLTAASGSPRRGRGQSDVAPDAGG
ncbi:RrF2 family transcriptional regulator [Actinomarinicola tropica]|nr:Rrf2 family transcriptional regulator [Actinomarinicola tropica]